MRIKRLLFPILFGFTIAYGFIYGVAQARVKPASLIFSTATTITVCADGCQYNSIQEAINVAGLGAKIDLGTETYTETLTIDKSIHLVGDGAQNTILQAAGSSWEASTRVITVASGVSVTLKGLTIRYGYVLSENGGGIYNLGTLIVSESIISHNAADFGNGGGIYNLGRLSTFETLIKSNDASMGVGGGIYNGAHNLILDHVTIDNNYASGGGGGIFSSGINHIFTNITITNNSTGDYGGGGGLANIDSNPQITNAVFYANSADYYLEHGGGGLLNIRSNPNLTNIVFQGNSAEYSRGAGISNIDSQPSLLNVTINGNKAGAFGGGIYNQNSDITITNSIIWDNSSSALPGTAAAAIFNQDSTPLINHTLVQGSGGSGNWDSILGTDGGGNLDADPGFISNSIDLHLQTGSPAINAGTNIGCPATDLDDHPRPIGEFCDLGAYEFGYLVYAPMIQY